MPGFFIVLDGPEGCGKSTQAQLLADRLRGLGHDVVLTHEPGGTAVGQAIRAVVLSPESGEVAPVAELLLMEADRAQHLTELIRPALAAGQVVVCDRFSISTFAYQAVAGGVGEELFEAAEAAAVGDTLPNLTVILDVPADLGLQRRLGPDLGPESGDRMEQKGLDFHRRVREGYLTYAGRYPGRCRLVDGRGTPEEVAEEVFATIAPYLPPPPWPSET